MARRIDALRLDTLTTRNNIAHWTEVLLASTHHPEAATEPGQATSVDALVGSQGE
jgi:hypothetical protein